MSSLILVIAANTIMVFSMRYAETSEADRRSVILLNYFIGTIMAIVLSKGISIELLLCRNALPALILAGINAVFMVCCMLVQQVSIQCNGAGLSTTYNRLGVLIPTILSIFIFQEIPTVMKIAGICLSVFAIVYSYEKANENSSKNYILLVLILAMGGFIDFNSKLLNYFAVKEVQPIYVIGTFFFSGLIMLVMVIVKKAPVRRKEVVIGAMIGIPNIFITFGMVRATAALPAYIVYPVYSGAVILLVNVISAVLLKEKLSKREIIATVLIAVALVLLNI